MKLGILLILIGLALIGYLLKFTIEKRFVKIFGVVVAVVLCVYGTILLVQPSEDGYIKYTQSTRSTK